ncbi:hypothetical protein GEMRC1_006074 [Eukaryota sp. GEM-RC1]
MSSITHYVSEFAFYVENFVTVPPVVSTFSCFSVLSTPTFNNLMLIVDSVTSPLNQELQIISIQNPTSILFENELNSVYLDIQITEFSLKIPPIIGLGFKYSSVLDLSILGDFDTIQLWAPKCELSHTVLVNNSLYFELTSSEPDIYNISMEVSYQNVMWTKSESFLVVQNPNFTLTSSRFINLAYTPSISLYRSSLPENSAFTLNHTSSLSYSVTSHAIKLSFSEDLRPIVLLPYNVYWQHAFYNQILIDSVILCYCYTTSTSSLSVIESRNIEINLNCHIPNFEFTCLIAGVPFSGKVIEDSNGSIVTCLNVVSPIYQPTVDVFLVVDDSLKFATASLHVDSQFADICFVNDQSIPLIPFHFVDHIREPELNSLPLKYLSILSSGVRCCDDSDCFVKLEPHDTLIIHLTSMSDIWSLSVSYLSDCHDTKTTLPFLFSLPSNLIESVTCVPFPSGFSTATMCQIYFLKNTILTSFLNFTFPTSINLTEIEVYGFPLNQCFRLLNSTSGQNSVNEVLPIDASYYYSDNLYSSFDLLLNTFANYISYFEQYHQLKFELFSDDCFQSNWPVDFLYYTGSPQYIYCDNVTSELETNSLVFCRCRDYFGFITSCSYLTQSDVNVQSLSHNQQNFEQLSFSFSSCCHSSCELHYNSIDNIGLQPTSLVLTITLIHSNFSSSFTLSLVQSRRTLLFASLLNSRNCPHLVEHKICIRVNFSLELVQVLPLTNQTRRLSAGEVDISSNSQLEFIIVDDYELDLYLYPSSTSNYVTFQSQGQSVSVSIPPVSCSYPFVLHEGQCFCPAGFYFNFEDCFPCPTGTFKSMNHDSCLPCPPNRVTHRNPSTSVNDCVCDRNLYQINDTCSSCPKNTVCRYGSIIKVRDGLAFDASNHVTVSCPLLYLCRNNSCISSRFFSIEDFCLSCHPGSFKRFSVCLQNSFQNYVYSALVNIMFIFLLTLFVRYFSSIYNTNMRKSSKFHQTHKYFKLSFDPMEAILSQQLVKPVICPLIVFAAIGLLLSNSVVLPLDLLFSHLLYVFPSNIQFQYILLCFHWLFVTVVLGCCWYWSGNSKLDSNLRSIFDSPLLYSIYWYLLPITVIVLQQCVLRYPFSISFYVCILIIVVSFCALRAIFQKHPCLNFSFLVVTLIICLELVLDPLLFNVCLVIIFLLCFYASHRFTKIVSVVVCGIYCLRLSTGVS